MNTPPESPVAELDSVCFRYGPAPAKSRDHGWILKDTDLRVEARDFLAVVGPNGGGKTTLLRLLLGLVEPQSGEVRLFGGPPALARDRLGYVPQYAGLDAGTPADALDIVLTGLLRRSSWGPRYSRRHREQALEALEATAAADLAHRPFGSLSGGQRQRVLIARALVSGAELLLLDEPTTGIDPVRERELLELLTRLNTERTLVMVTHDLDLAFEHATRVACVHHRHLTWIDPRQPPPAEQVAELFGVHLPSRSEDRRP